MPVSSLSAWRCSFQAWPASVAASAVSADEQPARSAVVAFSVQSPPAANTFHGEFGGVMRYSNVDHGPIPRCVAGAVWNSLAFPQMRKVVERNLVGIPLW